MTVEDVTERRGHPPLAILGMGHAHPHGRITSEFLESLDVGTTAEWIEEKIGIVERPTVLPLSYVREERNQVPARAQDVATESVVDLAVRAADQALATSGVKAGDIGILMVSCCTPPTTAPLVAHGLARRLGIKALSFDLGSACPSFALHLVALNGMRLSQPALGVCAAAYTQTVDYNDRTDGAIWADGAAAYVCAATASGRLQVIYADFGADPSRADAVVIERKGHFHQDGRAVRDFSVRHTVRMLKRLESRFNIDWARDIFIGHQANRTMLEQIANNRQIPQTNHWHNARHFGNQAAAGAPAVLSQNWHRLKEGQHVVVAVLGAGLTWGSVVFKVV